MSVIKGHELRKVKLPDGSHRGGSPDQEVASRIGQQTRFANQAAPLRPFSK